MDELIAELETLTLYLIEHLYESDDSRLIHFVEQGEWILNQFLKEVWIQAAKTTLAETSTPVTVLQHG
jgi:hypothetical protein